MRHDAEWEPTDAHRAGVVIIVVSATAAAVSTRHAVVRADVVAEYIVEVRVPVRLVPASLVGQVDGRQHHTVVPHHLQIRQQSGDWVVPVYVSDGDESATAVKCGTP